MGDTLVVRVGAAGLAEEAWWRYGRELRRRKLSFDSRRSRLAAYTLAALHGAASLVGMADDDLVIDWDDHPLVDVLRWRRFGWSAWRGRAPCPYCNSTLRVLRYDFSWWVYPLLGRGGRVEVGVPCTRCDPWTPDHVHRVTGPGAVDVLRRCLAYQNIQGAGEALVRTAARAIEEAGSASAFTAVAARRRECLWKMGSAGALALEVALGEGEERRALDLETRALEARWRREEVLADIIDGELSPPRRG